MNINFDFITALSSHCLDFFLIHINFTDKKIFLPSLVGETPCGQEWGDKLPTHSNNIFIRFSFLLWKTIARFPSRAFSFKLVEHSFSDTLDKFSLYIFFIYNFVTCKKLWVYWLANNRILGTFIGDGFGVLVGKIFWKLFLIFLNFKNFFSYFFKNFFILYIFFESPNKFSKYQRVSIPWKFLWFFEFSKHFL